MLAIPGIIALIIFIYVRPQEFFELLRAVPFLYVSLALAVFGVMLDFRLGNVRLRKTPQLFWVGLFFLWGAASVLIRDPASASVAISGLAICVTLYLLIAHAVQGFRSLHAVSGVVLTVVLVVCGIGTHQGLSPKGCVVVDATSEEETSAGRPDGRPCDAIRDCYIGDVEPGADYACEHVGLLGTTSVGGGRVRYRGVLQDPNELSLIAGIGLPLAFAFGQRKKKLRHRVLVLVTFALVLACAIMTQSRGGQLVFLTVLGAYFVWLFGKKGLVIGAVLAAPLLLLGGRDGSEASSSTMERLDCWSSALSIWRSHPLLGVGLGQFHEHNDMTAHNSYLLALAELGLPGMLLFSIVVYLSLKIPFRVLAEVRAGEERGGIPPAGAQLSRSWAMALVAAFAGLGVGIFFLSFTYHYVLWIYIGLSGALFSAVRTHHPSFEVRFGLKDFALVAVANAAIIVLVYGYTRWALA